MRWSKRLKIRAWAALSLGCVAFFSMANAEDSPPPAQALAPTTETSSIDQAKYADKVYWPMMPGESLEQLANSLYPSSPILKERFIKKTLSLSRALEVNIQPNEPFKTAGLLIIPNEKAVKELTHRIRKSEEIEQEEEKLKLSYRLKSKPIAAVTIHSTAPKQTAVTPSADATPTNTPSETIPKQPVIEPSSTLPDPIVTETLPPLVEEPAPVIKKAQPLPDPVLPKETPAKSSTAPATFSMPTLALPDIQMPEVQLPTIEWQRHWQSVTQQVGDWYKSGVALVKRANHQALLLKEEYASKNVSQVLHDYRLRNIALVSVLGIVFFGLWMLHKRRARRQKNMLSLIENTINPEAEFVVEIPEEKVEEIHPRINTAQPALTQVYDQKNYH